MEDGDEAKPGRTLDGRKLALLGIAAAVLVAAALAGWFAWKGHKDRQDESTTITAVGEATALLRERSPRRRRPARRQRSTRA